MRSEGVGLIYHLRRRLNKMSERVEKTLKEMKSWDST